jgi:hypothetical protein
MFIVVNQSQENQISDRVPFVKFLVANASEPRPLYSSYARCDLVCSISAICYRVIHAKLFHFVIIDSVNNYIIYAKQTCVNLTGGHSRN